LTPRKQVPKKRGVSTRCWMRFNEFILSAWSENFLRFVKGFFKIVKIATFVAKTKLNFRNISKLENKKKLISDIEKGSLDGVRPNVFHIPLAVKDFQCIPSLLFLLLYLFLFHFFSFFYILFWNSISFCRRFYGGGYPWTWTRTKQAERVRKQRRRR
jgi:hypothetical protein